MDNHEIISTGALNILESVKNFESTLSRMNIFVLPSDYYIGVRTRICSALSAGNFCIISKAILINMPELKDCKSVQIINNDILISFEATSDQDTIVNFEYNLQKSKDVFENLTNKPLKGFRAPKFSISHSHRKYLKVVSKYFEYDSSLNLKSISELKTISCDDININFFPVMTSNFFFNLLRYKPGGTYMKMFPYMLLYNNVLETFNKNENSILYLHPYEFLYDRELSFNISDLKNKNILFTLYWLIRQNQWISGNSFILKKLKKIFNEFESGGKIEELL